MSSPPDIDPYAELGLTKDATNAEIRASYRKRVLKCHPDKIQDATLRNAAQNEFQCVQQAYELLSDESRRARYDAKVKLAELKRELDQKRRTEAAYGRGSQEMRNGHVVEERVPFDTFFEENRFHEEPRSFSRKTDDYKRPKAKEEKRKTRAPTSSERAAKESRESTKASQYEQSRRRGKERRDQREEKFDSYSGPFVVEAESETSDDEPYYERTSSSRRAREARESRSRPKESSSRYRERDIYDEDKYDSKYSYRYEGDLKQAEAHIERSKYDNLRPRTSPHRSRGYESPEPETSASRRSARSSRATHTRSSSRNNSYEDIDQPRYERPKMPSSSTVPGLKTSLRPGLFGGGRSATSAGFTRSKTSSRDDTLNRMVKEVDPPRSSKSTREQTYDSGYSSPNTPDLPPKTSSPKVTARYKIDPEPTIIEPISSKSSRYRTVSAERERERDRPSRMPPPKRASTVQSYAEELPRIEVRSVRPSRPHGEPEFTSIRDENTKFARVIRPSDASISPGRTYWSNPAHVRTRRTAGVS